MRLTPWLLALMLPALAHPGGIVIPTRYKFEGAMVNDLGTLGGLQSVAHDINEGGDIAGEAWDASNKNHAVVWFNGQIHDLHNGTPEWSIARAYGINDNRVAVGEYVEPGSPQRYHAFYYYPGIWLTRMAGDNPAPELAFAWQTHAYAINKHGRIAGEGVRLPNPFLPPPPDMGDLCYERLPIQWPTGSPNPARLFCVSDVNNNNTWDDYEGMPPAAYDVNDSGNFVGTDGASTPNSMFLFKDGQRIPVPAPTGVADSTLYGIANGINNKNWVAGSYGWYNQNFRAFVWDGASASSINLGTFPYGTRSWAYEINEQNMVVGTSERGYGSSPASHRRKGAFIWHSDFGLAQLPSLGLTYLGDNTFGPSHCTAYSLNDRKSASGLVQVVGECDVDGNPHAVRWDVTISVQSVLQ